MSKFGALPNAGKKLKTTKQIAIATENAGTQTGLNMAYFEKLEKKMPSLFRIEELTPKCNAQENSGSGACQNANELQALDIDAHIELMIKQKVEEAEKMARVQQIQK